MWQQCKVYNHAVSVHIEHENGGTMWSQLFQPCHGCWCLNLVETHTDVRVRIWYQQHESIDLSFLVSAVHFGSEGGMMGPLIRIEHWLNTTAYRSIVADHVHAFMATIHPLYNDYSSTIMCHISQKLYENGSINMTMTSVDSWVTRSKFNRA